MIRSLQRRLLLGVVVGTSVVLLAVGLVLYLLIRVELYAQFDATLASEAHALATLVEQKQGRIQTEMAEHGVAKQQSEERPVYYQLWQSDGKLIERSSGLGSFDLQRLAGTPRQPAFQEVVLPDERVGRMVGFRFFPYQEENVETAEGPIEVTLVVARDKLDLDRTLRHVAGLLAGIFGGAVLISWLVATPIVRLGLLPLKRISTQIELMDTTALTERLDSTNAPDEVSVVIERLNALLGRLHEAFQRERAFSANVAHELRTPLAGLRSTIDVALAKPVESADYRRSLQKCQTICKQAESLTENLLMLARLDANQCQLERKSVTLDKLLEKAWESLSDRAASRGLEIAWGLPPSLEIFTDPTMLLLILRNLLDNSVSYADPNSSIEVHAGATAGMIEIRVSNRTSRMQNDLEQRVFDRFWRADAARSGTGEHAGLGLSLCRETARVLGGKLEVTVQEGIFTACCQLPQGHY